MLPNGRQPTGTDVEDDVDRPLQVDIPAAPQIRSRRNPKWIALGVIAICLGAIGSFFLYSQLSESHQVIAIRDTVHRGSTITQDDLAPVRVGNIDQVSAVPADRLPHLVGKVAAFDLVPGALLPPNAVTDELPPAADAAIVGVRLPTGRAPSGFLAPGSPIRMVVLPDPEAAGTVNSGTDSNEPGTNETGSDQTGIEEGDGGEGSPDDAGADASVSTRVIDGTVVNTVKLDNGVLINVQVHAGQAVGAASYAAQDRIAVIRDSER